jgi:hypothetical protein
MPPDNDDSDTPTVDLETGLIGHWRFDEETGNVATDSSGNNNHGRLINAQPGTGDFKGSVELSGANDSHVSVPGSETLNSIVSQITVTARLFPRTLGQGFTVAVSRQIGTLLHPDQFYLGFGPEHGVLHYKWHLGVQDAEGDCYFGEPAAGRWVTLAGTYDGQTMRLYVDGQEIGNRSLSGQIRVDDNPVTIGAEENGPEPGVVENEFDGFVDDVRIYNRVLSREEIEAVGAPVS